jgi:pyrroloquinoline quinone biosynthesis protein B
MYLGREAMNAKDLPVYVLPRMKKFLEMNGPWSQLVRLKNITLRTLSLAKETSMGSLMSMETFTVPHRDEYSETAGFRIDTKGKDFLFIPDIDKWTKFNGDIVKMVNAVDHAFLDATFYSAGELPGRNAEEIPHPTVKESMQYFGGNFDINIKKKICFIHFNHTNPLIRKKDLRDDLRNNGYEVAEEGMIFR